jgi:hypothetical protein
MSRRHERLKMSRHHPPACLSRLDWRRPFEHDRRGLMLSRMGDAQQAEFTAETDAVAGIILSRIAASCRRAAHRVR